MKTEMVNVRGELIRCFNIHRMINGFIIIAQTYDKPIGGMYAVLCNDGMFRKYAINRWLVVRHPRHAIRILRRQFGRVKVSIQT